MTGRCLLITGVLLTSGCSGPSQQKLDARSFVRAGDPVEQTPEVVGPPAPVIPVTQLSEFERLADASAIAGPPVLDPNAPSNDAAPVLIDELVGEINGQPIFANEFLSELGDSIASIPRQFEEDYGRPPTERQWQEEAYTTIRNELVRLVRDELVKAESYRKLDVPQANLRRFLEAVRKNEVSLRGGSAAAADRSLEEETGLSMDELERMRGDEVVLLQFLRTFHAGISVSPRDIERYYVSHPEEFNPDPTVSFWWIKLLETDTEAIARIGEVLAETRPEDVPETFKRLAGDEANQFSPSTGGLREAAFKGELRDQFFVRPRETLNEALVNLEPGEFAGPIEHNGYVSWVFVEKVRKVSISLYDAQAIIEEKLRIDEFNRRLDMELLRLQERAGITKEQLDVITVRLLEIAIDRYQ